jgi:hypothetical protein
MTLKVFYLRQFDVAGIEQLMQYKGFYMRSLLARPCNRTHKKTTAKRTKLKKYIKALQEIIGPYSNNDKCCNIYVHVFIIPHVQTQSNRVCNSLVILL